MSVPKKRSRFTPATVAPDEEPLEDAEVVEAIDRGEMVRHAPDSTPVDPAVLEALRAKVQERKKSR
jgi:hypothetical protein